MNPDFIRNCITELRIQKDVSEHRMSLDLGHARSYIHGIVCGRTLPSMAEFLAICDYFDISPALFFDEKCETGVLLTRLNKSAKDLTEDDLAYLVALAERLGKK